MSLKYTNSVSSSSAESFVEDEDFQLANEVREKRQSTEVGLSVGSRCSSTASLMASVCTSGGSQTDLAAAVEPTDGKEVDLTETNDQQTPAAESSEKDSVVEEMLYSEEAQQSALRNLIVFSIIMFTLPMAVIYAAYTYFIEHLHLPRDEAALYAGILGIVSVLIVVIVFLWVAYREVRSDGERVERYRQLKKEQ